MQDGGYCADLPDAPDDLAVIDHFRQNETGTQPLDLAQAQNCNGYWRRKVAGLELNGITEGNNHD